MAGSIRQLDTTGKLCPLPILLTERALADLAPGDHLELIGDDPALPLDVRAFCARWGHLLLEIEKLPGGYRCRIEKAAGDDRADSAALAPKSTA